MSQPFDIVGYTYSADQYCPEHIIEVLITNREASPAARDMNVEEALWWIASANAIDYDNPHSYDSDDFPKVIFRDQVDASERCGWCGEPLEDQ